MQSLFLHFVKVDKSPKNSSFFYALPNIAPFFLNPLEIKIHKYNIKTDLIVLKKL